MKKSIKNETNKECNGTRVLDEGVAPGRCSAVVQQGGPGRYQVAVAQNYVEKADARGGGEKVCRSKEKGKLRKNILLEGEKSNSFGQIRKGEFCGNVMLEVVEREMMVI